MSQNNIHSGHRERLRKQIEQTNPVNLSDLHFLEQLLTYTIPRADTNPIAHNLLEEFKTIPNIFDATETALLTIDGIGPKTANFLHYMSTTCYMYNRAKWASNEFIGTINKCLAYIKSVLPPSINEQFIVLILNKNLEIKNYKIFNGISHSYINFDAQELSSYLINHKASFCIVAHTHPYCSAIPSADDLETFNKMTPLFDSLSIKLLDSLILGEHNYFSCNLQDIHPYDYTDVQYKHLKPLNDKILK